MGADMILEWFCIDESQTSKEGLEETKNKLLSAVSDLEFESDYELMVISSEEMNIYDDVEEEAEEFELKMDKRQKIVLSLDDRVLDYKKFLIIKDKFKKIIEETMHAITHYYRDVSFINHKGSRLYLTGGMSYGDSPTDSYEHFTKFINLPGKILDAGGIYL